MRNTCFYYFNMEIIRRSLPALQSLLRVFVVGLTAFFVAPTAFTQYIEYQRNNLKDLHFTTDSFRYLIPTVFLLFVNLVSFHPYYGIVLYIATTSLLFVFPKEICNPATGVPCLVEGEIMGSIVIAWLILSIAHALEWVGYFLMVPERKAK